MENREPGTLFCGGTSQNNRFFVRFWRFLVPVAAPKSKFHVAYYMTTSLSKFFLPKFWSHFQNTKD